VRPRTLTALLASAALGVALGVGGGLVLDRGATTQHGDDVEDPLSLGVPLVNQPCDGGFVIAIGKGDGGSALAPGLAANPTGRYLDTGESCDTAWMEHDRATPRWVAYLGPYDSGRQACTVRMTPSQKGTTVSRLRQGTPDTIHCLCYLDYKTMPTLRTGMTPDITDVMWTFALQNLLVDMGRAEEADTNGVYGPSTASKVSGIQREHALPVTGVVDADTWHALQDGCDVYDEPSPNASS
jgi:peptidoglycan hydrolase-like protein with peptidoglycan-binding domain